MAFRVFISHSTADMGVVEQLKYWLELNGIEAYVAQLYPQPGMPLSDKVRQAIRECDCFLALLTRNGVRSQWVHWESGVAVEAERLVVPIREVGVDEPGYLKGKEWIEFNPLEPAGAINQAIGFLHQQKVAKEKAQTATAILITVVGLFALAAAASEKAEPSY